MTRSTDKARLLWHATNRAFDRFDPDRSGLGTHFGTYRAATGRQRQASSSGSRAGEAGAWKATKYRVTMARPLRVKDVGAWDSEADVEHGLLQSGVMNRADLRESRSLSGAAFWRWARARIEAAGYDAVVYRNNLEDVGKDSFVLWRDDQIEYAPLANPLRKRRQGRARRERSRRSLSTASVVALAAVGRYPSESLGACVSNASYQRVRVGRSALSRVTLTLLVTQKRPPSLRYVPAPFISPSLVSFMFPSYVRPAETFTAPCTILTAPRETQRFRPGADGQRLLKSASRIAQRFVNDRPQIDHAD